MPMQTYLILLISAITAAGATIGLAWTLGISLLWLALVAVLLALLVRKVKW